MTRFLRWRSRRFVAALLLWAVVGSVDLAAEPRGDEFDGSFRETVLPFLKEYCHTCHGTEMPKGKLDLTSF